MENKQSFVLTKTSNYCKVIYTADYPGGDLELFLHGINIYFSNKK